MIESEEKTEREMYADSAAYFVLCGILIVAVPCFIAWIRRPAGARKSTKVTVGLSLTAEINQDPTTNNHERATENPRRLDEQAIEETGDPGGWICPIQETQSPN